MTLDEVIQLRLENGNQLSKSIKTDKDSHYLL